MLYKTLLETAVKLAEVSRGRPRQADLRRAESTLYYAMFHYLAQCCADTLVGYSRKHRSKHAWRQVYRALKHGPARARCRDKQTLSQFPEEIRDFAGVFASLQEKRELADYDPWPRELTKGEVFLDLIVVYGSLVRFRDVPIKDRRAFAVFLLFEKRNEPQDPHLSPKINVKL